MAVFHSWGTNPTGSSCGRKIASAFAILNFTCLNNNKGGSLSGPEERFGFSLPIAEAILRSSNSTVSIELAQKAQRDCPTGIFPLSTTPTVAKFSALSWSSVLIFPLNDNFILLTLISHCNYILCLTIFAARCFASAAYAVMRCPSVCLPSVRLGVCHVRVFCRNE